MGIGEGGRGKGREGTRKGEDREAKVPIEGREREVFFLLGKRRRKGEMNRGREEGRSLTRTSPVTNSFTGRFSRFACLASWAIAQGEQKMWRHRSSKQSPPIPKAERILPDGRRERGGGGEGGREGGRMEWRLGGRRGGRKERGEWGRTSIVCPA